MSIILVPNFSPLTRKLRQHFELVQNDIHNPRRFVWDWWHLPNRYTHLRTPAVQYFTKSLHNMLETALVEFGRERLGCQAVSPIWLSNYVEGCEQKLHADRPHGPWAFVLPLTLNKRKFSGGETLLLKPQILNFWNQSFSRGKNFECDDILERIDAQTGRLLVFDPRIPHGVSRVSNTVDPLEGRLVLHGWFTQPRPFVDGPVSTVGPNGVENSLAAFDQVLAESALHFQSTGTIAFCISISPNGTVTQVNRLASSLTSPSEKETTNDRSLLFKLVQKHFKKWIFPKAGNRSRLFLPLSFEVQ